MNAKILVFVICVEAIISLMLYNLHDCTFNRILIESVVILFYTTNQLLSGPYYKRRKYKQIMKL